MMCYGCIEERKAYFQKLGARVKTIIKDKKRKVAKGRMLKTTNTLQRQKTRNGRGKTGSM